MNGKLDFKKWLKDKEVDKKTTKMNRLTISNAAKKESDGTPPNTSRENGLDEV